MIRIKTIDSEAAIRKSIVKNFKHYRTVNQTAFYLGEGSDHCYDPDVQFSRRKYNYTEIAQTLNSVLAETKALKVAIVSLACGNCSKDKEVLEQIQKAGHTFSFIGVDSSMDMLYKADTVLREATFSAQLVCADIGAFDFKQELERIIGAYDLTIYLFFGNTFIGNILGNLNQNYMMGLLNTIVRPGDYMLIDAASFETITPEIEDKILERYTGYLDNLDEVAFFLVHLKTLGVTEDCGKLTLKITKDSATQGQKVTFKFVLHNPMTLTLDKEEITLSPDECIDLFYIVIYDLHKLTSFLEKKNYTLTGQIPGDFYNQLLFQKQ